MSRRLPILAGDSFVAEVIPTMEEGLAVYAAAESRLREYFKTRNPADKKLADKKYRQANKIFRQHGFTHDKGMRRVHVTHVMAKASLMQCRDTDTEHWPPPPQKKSEENCDS